MAKFLVNGESVDSLTKNEYPVHNPADGSVVDTAPRGDARDVDAAVDAAEHAFPKWWATPAAKRGEIVAAGARTIKEHEDELAQLLTSEQGKPLRESRLEIRRFVHTLEHYYGLAKNLRGGYVPNLDEGKYGIILKRPIGVVASIVPWNFPVSLMGNKIAPALVAGNTIVVKPASTTPLTDIRCVQLLNEAGLPPGVLNIVTGPGATVGEAILTHPKIRKIGFTGATVTGRHVMKMAADTIKRVTLELGGSDPLIVCDDANLEQAASAASVGRFFNCGQACLAVKRLYIFDSIYDQLVNTLVARVGKLKAGNGQQDVFMGPLHTAGQREEVEAQVADAVKKGATVLVGASRPQGAEYEKGFFLNPTLVADAPLDSKMVTEEVFGPALPIWRVKNLDAAIELANQSVWGLGASVFTRDLTKARHAAERLEAGNVWINSIHIGYDELPFGGTKMSGIGREYGPEALEYYLEPKGVVVATG